MKQFSNLESCMNTLADGRGYEVRVKATDTGIEFRTLSGSLIWHYEKIASIDNIDFAIEVERELVRIGVEAKEVAMNCVNGNCGRYQTKHIEGCEFAAKKISTYIRYELGAGPNESFDPARYSKYYERMQMADRGEIEQSEIYGLEQCREHAKEVWARSEGMSESDAAYWANRRLQIRRIETITEEVEDLGTGVAGIPESGVSTEIPCSSCGLIEGCHTSDCPNDPDRPEVVTPAAETPKHIADVTLIAQRGLTDLEQRFMTAFIDGLYAEPHFSDQDVKDVAESMGESISTAKGVLGSLVKKGYVTTEDSGTGFDLIYLEQDHFDLHTEWRTDEYDGVEGYKPTGYLAKA